MIVDAQNEVNESNEDNNENAAREKTDILIPVTRTVSGSITSSAQKFNSGRPYRQHQVRLLEGQKLSLSIQSSDISFEGVWSVNEDIWISGNTRFKEKKDILVPENGNYLISVSGDRSGVTGSYSFTATAVPGPLEIGPATKPATGGEESVSGLYDSEPPSYTLAQNAPNPFNPATTIRYALPEAGEVRLAIYNALGQEVRTLIQGRQEAGYYRVMWDGRDAAGRQVSSGLYFYRLTSSGFAETRKMLLLK